MKDWINRSLKGGLLAFLLLFVAFSDVHAATTNLGINEPTVGADADTWGTKINTALDRIDATVGGSIYGLTLSTAGSSGTFGIAVGGASGMSLASAYTKTTSSWALGTAAGALDTGAIANTTWYHVWLIERVDTGVVDVLVSTSATSPTMPANYTRKRRIGSMLTDGSAHWKKFLQYGDQFIWDVMVSDASSNFSSSTAVLFTLSVPTGVNVLANVTVQLDYNASNEGIVFTSPDQTNTAVSSSVLSFVINSTLEPRVNAPISVMTNTSAQIRGRAESGSSFYKLLTTGWVDTRGR